MGHDASEHTCADDQEAWSEAVTLVGEILRTVDGDLPDPTNWTLRVSEGKRKVATIEVTACRHRAGRWD